MAGLFIAIEGPDGVGKSDVSVRLADAIRRSGRDIMLVRDPGGSPTAEQVRHLLSLLLAARVGPVPEVLAYSLSRAISTKEVVAPALAQGKVVVSDRWGMSTRAYQYGRDATADYLIGVLENTLSTFCVEQAGRDVSPDVYVVLTADPGVLVQRLAYRADQRGVDMEDPSPAELARIQDRYLEIMSGGSPMASRTIHVDTTAKQPQAVCDEIMVALKKRGVL